MDTRERVYDEVRYEVGNDSIAERLTDAVCAIFAEERAAFQDALKRYGRHMPSCCFEKHGKSPAYPVGACTCGLFRAQGLGEEVDR